MTDIQEDYEEYVEDYGIEFGGDYEGYDEGYGGEEDPTGFSDDYTDEPDYIQENEYDEYAEEGPEFQTEMGAYGEGGRVEIKRTIDQFKDLLVEGGLSTLTQAIGREYKNPIERFSGTVDAVCRSLGIEEEIIETILLKILSLKNVEYINPVGYIFGYIATDGGREMDNAKIQGIFRKIDVYNNMLNAGMEQPDVIRYARFWINFRRSLND